MSKKKTGKESISGHRQLHVKVKSARGRKKSSTKWLQRQLNDPYVQLAQKEGYRSRAAYKLIEIDDKFDFLKDNQNIIDLGAAPGGWIQVLTRRCKNSKIIGIDLQEIEPISDSILIQHDFTENDAPEMIIENLNGQKCDVVLSDMAAPACGHPQTDHIRIMMLCELAFDFAKEILKDGGVFVAKVLRGGTEKELLDDIKKHFKTVKHFKPGSSRKDSAETYLVAMGFNR